MSEPSVPQIGVWMVTYIEGTAKAPRVKVTTEYRESSCMVAGLFYNELMVWIVAQNGLYTSLEHQEQSPTNPRAAALRHIEIVRRLAEGIDLEDKEPQS